MSKANNKVILFLVVAMSPITGLGIDIYGPSLPAIAQHFSVSNYWVQLTIFTYFAGYGIGQLFYGPVSDGYGRRPTLIIGCVVYVISSLLCSLAPSIAFLLFLRFIQGLGVAVFSVIAKTLLADTFSGNEFNKAVTYMTMSWTSGPMIGPVIGGYIQYYLGWRYNFIFLTLYGFIILLFALHPVAETNIKRARIGIKEILHNYSKIATNKTIIGFTLSMAAIYAIIIIFNAIAPFLIQVHLNYSSIAYGHFILLLGVMLFLGTFSNRFLLNRFQILTIARTSLIFMFIIALVMLLLALTVKMSIYNLIIPMMLLIYLSALILPNYMALAISQFKHIAGAASAFIGFLLFFLTGAFTALATLLKSTNQIPMTSTFLGLLTLSLFFYFALLRKKV